MLYKMARSSKLKIDVDEEEKYVEDLNKIIFFIHKLDEVDFEDDSDFHFVNRINLSLRDDIREKKFQSIDLIKNNAPDFRNNYFVLPNHLKKERK